MSVRIILAPLICCAILLSAAPAPVGIVTSAGSIRLDGAEVRGNGTVLDGSLVETAGDPTQVILKNGVRLELAAQSRARLFDSHLVLELGAGALHAARGYSMRANSLSILPKGPSAIRVLRASASRLQVSAVAGQAEVESAGGVWIATVLPGSPLEFDQPPAGAAGATRISGRLEQHDGAYSVVDFATKSRLEVQGENLEKVVGQCISGDGSSDPGNAALIHLATYSRVSCGKRVAATDGAAAASKSDAAGGPNAGGAAGVTSGVAAGGLSTPVLTAIIVGGAVAGTLGGVAAAGVFTGGTPTPVSAP